MMQYKRYSIGLLFFCAFMYSLITSVLIRESIIPYVYPQSVDGHMPADPYMYHLVAKKMLIFFGREMSHLVCRQMVMELLGLPV